MKNFITRLVIIIILLLFSATTFASHIAGGVITYQCLGSNQYKVTFKFYRDCSGVNAPSPAQIEIFNSANTKVQTLNLPLISTVLLPANAPNPCTTVPTGICVEEITYTGNVTLPPIPGGYQLTFDLCCRNPGIVNGPANSSAYSTWIPDVSKATCNNSAVYASAPPMFVCAGLPLNYNHSATDADGDVLTYSLCSAIESAVPLVNYPHSAPYTATNPLGGGLSINPTTGLITGTPSTIGKFVVGVCVTETRNGVVINTTTRDFQWNVVDCQIATVASALSALTNCQTREVTFFNNSIGGVSYKWTFGDGSTATTTSTSPLPHVYSTLGTFSVTLVSFATNGSCNDTVKSLVTVVDTCRPCGMSANITTVDGLCGTLPSGCAQITFTAPCSGGLYFTYNNCVRYNNATCGAGSNGCAGGTGNSLPLPNFDDVTAIISGLDVHSPTANPTIIFDNAYCTSAHTTSGSNPKTYTFNAMVTNPQPGGATATITGGTPPYVINWTTTPSQTTFTNPSTITEVAPGTYTAVISDAYGCTQTQTFVISGNSTLAFTPTKTDATGCGLNNGTLSAGAVTGSTGTVTYLWSPGGYTTANVNNVAPGTYTVLVNDGAGCPKSGTVTVGGVPTISVNATIPNLLCSYSTNGTSTASASGGATPYTYSWNTSPVQTGPTATGLTKGFYMVTATDNNGCKGTFAFSVASPAALTLTTGKTNPLCFGGATGSATVTATGGTGTKTYSWNSTPVKTTATATGLAAGTYIITVTDANGCTANASVTLTNPPPIIHDIVNTSTMSCAGVFVGKAQETASGGTGALTYNWTPGNPSGDGTASVTGLTAGTWTCTVTDANNCAVTDVVVITNPGVLTTTATSTPTCGGTNNGTAIVTPVGGIEPYTYSWSPGAATTQSISGLAGGATYIATVTDKGGCTATASVTIATTPALAPTTVVSGCGTNAAIDLSVSGGTSPYTYVWSHGPTSQDLTGLSAATYTVTVWDINNCYITTATTVPVISCNPSVVANPITICNGACGTITATGSVGATPYTYAWTPATGLSATTGVSVSACPTSTTTYTITITDNVLATGSTRVVVTVNPKPTVSVPAATICNGNSTTLTATGADTFTWTTTTGLSSGTGTTVTANPTVTSTYTVVGTTTATGCTNSTTVIVTVNPKPVVTVPPASICPGGSTPVTASGADTYTWSPATGLSATTGATVTANPAVTTTYTVVGTSLTCTGSTTVVVTVGALVANAGTDVAICAGGSTTLGASGGTIFTWTPATGLSDPAIANPVATPTVTTTYTVLVSDGTCSDDDIVIVTVNPNPVVAVPAATICNGKNTTLTASGADTYAWAPATGLSNPAIANPVASPTITTTYTVTGTTTATGCTGVTTVIVTVNPNPVVSVPGATICEGNATGLTANGADTYTWAPATGLSATTGTSVNANPIITTTYTVVGTTTASGCTGSATVVVTVIPPCGPGVSATGYTVCNGICGTVTSTATGGVPPYNYSWDNGETTASINVCPTVNTTYTITVTDNSTPVGTATAIAVVTVNPNPVVTVPAATICNGASTTLTASGADTYVWSPTTNLSSGTGTSVTADPSSTTTYTITGSFATGCTGVTTVVVTVNPIPVVAVPGASICPGGSTTLNATGADTYSWSPATGLSATTGASVTASPAISTTYTVCGTSLGCSSCTTVTVAVGALVANAGPDVAICYGASTNLNASGGTFYTWTPATGLSDPAISNPVATPSVTTTYTVVASDGSCSDDDVMVVTVDPPISLNVAGINVTCFGACNGQIIVIPTGGSGAYTYSWSSGCTAAACNNICAGTYNVTATDGAGCTATGSATVTEPIALTVALTGSTNVSCFGLCDGTASVSAAGGTTPYSYAWSASGGTSANASGLCFGSYTVTVTDANGCTATTTAQITQPSRITVTSTAQSMCPNTSATLTASGTGGFGTINYSWNPGALTGTSVTVAPVATITFTLVGTDGNGCSGTNTVVVTVDPTPVVVVPAAAICEGTSTTLNATGAISYSWTPSTGLSNSSIANPLADPTITTTYTVTGTNSFGCTGSVEVIVTVNPKPIVSSTDGHACPGDSIPLSVSGDPGNTYLWIPATRLDTIAGPNVIATPIATKTYTVIATGTNTCTSAITVTATVDPRPKAAFTSSPQPTDIFSPTVYFNDQSLGGPFNIWDWSFGDTKGSGSSVQNPMFIYPDTAKTYLVKLIVTNVFGCIDSVVNPVTIRGIFTFYVPNTFTPNNDGVNDGFLPQGVGIDEENYHLWVFDRWGNLIWQTEIWGEAWNGKANGGSNIAQIDTYVWKVFVKEKESGTKHNYIGHVNIVK